MTSNLFYYPRLPRPMVERAEGIFGHVRFKQDAKIARFTELLDQNFDFARLYDELGLVVG